MNNFSQHTDTIGGIMGGTGLVLIVQINNAEILKTAVLAGVGAAVSFLVSVSLKWLIRQFQKKKES